MEVWKGDYATIRRKRVPTSYLEETNGGRRRDRRKERKNRRKKMEEGAGVGILSSAE